MRNFTQFACIDWSGANVERPPGIAVGQIGPTGPPTLITRHPHWSREDVKQWLLDLARTKTNILIGFDLSMAFPYFDEMNYFPSSKESPINAKALWKLIDQISADDPHLGASSFLRHNEALRHFRHSKDHIGDLFTGGIGRLRAVERHQRETGQGNSSSCFNLVGASQVGKSSLTGMRMLHQLNGAVPIWPFDPLPKNGPVIVEIYTTLAAWAAGLPKGRSKIRDYAGLKVALDALNTPCPSHLQRYDDHSTDALVTAAWIKQVAGNRELWAPTLLTDAIAEKEGWTFGVI